MYFEHNLVNLISLFSSGFYVVTLCCPVPCLSPSDGSTGRGLQTNLTRSGKKAFPLLFHENPASRTFATSIPHTVLFSNKILANPASQEADKSVSLQEILSLPESHYVFRQNPESREYPFRHSLLRSRY